MNSTETIELWLTIKQLVPYILPALLSAAATYFAARHEFKLGQRGKNIDVNRVRFLINIAEVEEFIQLLKDLGYLNILLSKMEELNESLDSNLELIRNDQREIEEEINFIEKEMHNNSDPKINDIHKEKIKNLSSELTEIMKKIISIESQQKGANNEIYKIREKFDDVKENIMSADIGPAGYIVDPTGELVNYLQELLDLYTDPDKPTISSSRIIELRGKIDKFFKDSIRKFS